MTDASRRPGARTPAFRRPRHPARSPGRAPTPGGGVCSSCRSTPLARGAGAGAGQGRMPFLRRVIERGGWRLHPLFVGCRRPRPPSRWPRCTGCAPTFPASTITRSATRGRLFPARGDAARVEREQRRGGAASSRAARATAAFHGGAVDNLFTFAIMKRPSGSGLLAALSASSCSPGGAQEHRDHDPRAGARRAAVPRGSRRRVAAGFKWLAIKSASRCGCASCSRWPSRATSTRARRHLRQLLDYDVMSHAYGPGHGRACARCGAWTTR